MIAPVNLSVPHVNSESERTASGGFKCRSCTNIEQKLFVVDSSSGEIICQKCGAILEIENINQNQDWNPKNQGNSVQVCVNSGTLSYGLDNCRTYKTTGRDMSVSLSAVSPTSPDESDQ